MKKCKKCGLEKDISNFNNRKKSKDGLDYTCKECVSEFNKKYNLENKLKIKIRRSNFYKENKDRLNDISNLYHEINKDKIKEYNSKESVKIRYRNYKREYKKKRSKTDILYFLTERIRKNIHTLFKTNGFKKSKKTVDILGCSFDDFKLHIESKFEPWMNWDNKGLYNGEFDYGWDIDHIVPLSTATTEEDLIRLNHYTNLQPLCSKVNRDIKRDKQNYEV